MDAARQGHTATVTGLVALGADIDARGQVPCGAASTRDHRSCAALSSHRFAGGQVAVHIDLPVITALGALQAGVTAMLWAAVNGHTATVVELVRLRSDINTKDDVRASWSLCDTSVNSPL